MNTNMPMISVDNKLLSSLSPDDLKKILTVVAYAGLVKEGVALVKVAAPHLRHFFDRVCDLATAKLALKYGRDPREISDLYEKHITIESTAA